MKVYLVGFMACGKTTIGRLLAERLQWPFIDLDERIETDRGMAISRIFETRGEEEFRKLETEALRGAGQANGSAVVALGGGTFAQPSNLGLVAASGVSVWLDCPFPIVQRRIGKSSTRPLARDPRRFQELFESRREFYSQARFRVPVGDDDPAIAVGDILRLPLFQ